MYYLLLFLIAPAAASFIVQCILCCKMKNRILRHGTLILPMLRSFWLWCGMDDNACS